MIRYFIIYSLLFCQALFADTLQVKKLDLNNNGKIDRFEYYDKDKLVRVEIDRDNDTKIDEKIVYSSEKVFETRYSRRSSKGNFLKKITFEKDPKRFNKIIKHTYLDNNDDSVYERSFIDTLKSYQKKDSGHCSTNFEVVNLEDFPNKALSLVAAVTGGFLNTDFGFQVDKKCLNKWGDSFLNDLKETKEKGMSCLQELYEKSGSEKITGALENYKGLKSLYKKSQVKLICSEEDYDWDATAGHASTGDESNKVLKPKASHPFISINPNYPESKPVTLEERKELASTIFHEGLHNLGHRHGTGYEYAYTCETCCFQEESDEKETIDIACKLCLGDYKMPMSKAYINDFIDWTKLEYKEQMGSAIARSFIKENPKSADAILLLAKSESSNFNNVGAELLDLLKDKVIFTSMDDIVLSSIISKNKTYDSKDEKIIAKSIAKSIYYTYYEQDGLKAIEELEKNKELFKKMYIESQSEHLVFKTFRASDTYNTLKSTIYENWLNEYPASSPEVATRFYKLFTFIEDSDKI